jgi:hypothetical protein
VAAANLLVHDVTERVSEACPDWAAQYPSYTSRYQRVWRILHGRRKGGRPTRTEAAAIADALDAPPWELWPDDFPAPVAAPGAGRWSWSRA